MPSAKFDIVNPTVYERQWGGSPCGLFVFDPGGNFRKIALSKLSWYFRILCIRNNGQLVLSLSWRYRFEDSIQGTLRILFRIIYETTFISLQYRCECLCSSLDVDSRVPQVPISKVYLLCHSSMIVQHQFVHGAQIMHFTKTKQLKSLKYQKRENHEFQNTKDSPLTL